MNELKRINTTTHKRSKSRKKTHQSSKTNYNPEGVNVQNENFVRFNIDQPQVKKVGKTPKNKHGHKFNLEGSEMEGRQFITQDDKINYDQINQNEVNEIGVQYNKNKNRHSNSLLI